MRSAGPSSSFSAFVTADAGFEYLASAEHYQHLAMGVVDALRRDSVVLLTGDPPADPPMLAAALREAAAPRAVIELACSPDLDCAKLFAQGSMPPDTPAPAAVGDEPDRGVPPPSPIFVFANAELLSDHQIEDLCDTAQAIPTGSRGFEARVLLAHSDFVARAKSAELHPFDEGLAGHLRVQQLERDEIEAFIRHQLPPGEGANLLTAQRVALIALTSGGDPAVVNRLARRMLENEPGVSAPPPTTRRRSAASLKLSTGIIIFLGVVWFSAGAFEPQHLGALVGLVRDRILPRNERVAAPAGRGAVPSPEAGTGSFSVNVAIAPPRDPGATSDPRSTPEPAPRSKADGPQLSAAEIAALTARGDAFLSAGDIASARLFFERAADAGDGRAAMRMAVTYDAAFLERVGLPGLRGDPERAAFWYRRARELGEGQAEPRLGNPGTEPTPRPR